VPTLTRYPHIEKPPSAPARLERLPRIHVSQIVLPHLLHGWSADEIARQYPHLNLAEIHTALAYYFDHVNEIDREIEAELAADDRLRAEAAQTPLMIRLKAKLRS
jgi:hypothetical protein